jgi:hypothetical protein
VRFFNPHVNSKEKEGTMDKKLILGSLVVVCLIIFPLIQVSFADTTIYDVTRNTGYVLGDNNGVNGFNEVVGEYVVTGTQSELAGKGFNKITVYLNKCGGCNSNALVYIGVWNSSIAPTSGNMLKSFGTINSSALSETVGTPYTFSSSGGYNIPANGGVVIGVGRFVNPTQADAAGANTANVFNGTNTYLARYETTWQTNVNQDFAMKLELTSGGGGTGAGSSGNVCLNNDANGDGVVNLLDCLQSCGALCGITGSNTNVTTIGTIIGQGVGLIDANNSNPRTNGVGLFYMLITGTFFAIALMSTVHTLHMRGYISATVKEIDPIFWLFLVVGTVSVAWYLDWIDDIIFAAMTVGLAGLVAFGVLKHLGRV